MKILYLIIGIIIALAVTVQASSLLGGLMYYDIQNGYLGIGVENPTTALDVLGNVKVSGTISSGGKILSNSAYTLSIQALTSSPVDGQTVYFGQLPKSPTTSPTVSRVYIRKSGSITASNISVSSGTSGSAEAWSLYIRKNNTTDTLIGTISTSTGERLFATTTINIPVVSGDYIEIKGVQPTWATNPLTTVYGGYILIE